jgi:hypothetical protein|tara:strand:+ start:500 stop:772 length:273 start_codon:yes stop_codon:yes gene_type:complete
MCGHSLEVDELRILKKIIDDEITKEFNEKQTRDEAIGSIQLGILIVAISMVLLWCINQYGWFEDYVYCGAICLIFIGPGLLIYGILELFP